MIHKKLKNCSYLIQSIKSFKDYSASIYLDILESKLSFKIFDGSDFSLMDICITKASFDVYFSEKKIN